MSFKAQLAYCQKNFNESPSSTTISRIGERERSDLNHKSHDNQKAKIPFRRNSLESGFPSAYGSKRCRSRLSNTCVPGISPAHHYGGLCPKRDIYLLFVPINEVRLYTLKPHQDQTSNAYGKCKLTASEVCRTVTTTGKRRRAAGCFTCCRSWMRVTWLWWFPAGTVASCLGPPGSPTSTTPPGTCWTCAVTSRRTLLRGGRRASRFGAGGKRRGSVV